MSEIFVDEKNTTIEAAKYLIQLFMSTKYQCNRQKLQKLILFAHFALLMDGEDGLLGTENISATRIGLGIDSVSEKYHFLNFNGINERIKIPETSFEKKPNDSFTIEYQYDLSKLSYSQISMLKQMFINFGAYHSDILSNVTKKFDLYEDNADKLNEYPKIYICSSTINEYVEKLKNDKNNSALGQDIIIKEIEDSISRIF